MKRLLAIAIAIVGAMSSSSHALSMSEKQSKSNWESYIEEQQNTYVKPLCGKAFEFVLTDKFVSGYVKADSNPKGYFDDIFWVIKSLCEDESIKADFTSAFKGVRFYFGKKLKFKQKKGFLLIMMPSSVMNLSSEAQEFIKKNF